MTQFPAHLYCRITHMTVAVYVDLVRELMRVRLDDSIPELTPSIDRAADELEATADEAEAALAELGDAHDPQVEAIEVAFETRTDEIANLIEGSIDSWSYHLEPSISELRDKKADDPEAEAKREREREIAVRAKGVHAGIFGDDGLDFFRMSYAERFQTLSALLRTLTKDDMGIDFAELLQPPFDKHIHIIATKYERELAEHLAVRDDSHGLADQRVALRLALAAYVHLLREAPDRWSKDSCDRVNTALMPLEDRCKQLGQRH